MGVFAGCEKRSKCQIWGLSCYTGVTLWVVCLESVTHHAPYDIHLEN